MGRGAMYFLDEIWVYDFYDSIYLTFSLKQKNKEKTSGKGSTSFLA
jgi:hypothetical protein